MLPVKLRYRCARAQNERAEVDIRSGVELLERVVEGVVFEFFDSAACAVEIDGVI
jgi:hypothetical protein